MSTESRILLVEDDPTDAELTRRALERHARSFRIQVARDGEEALAILEGENDGLRLVVLDLKIPKRDGLEVLDILRQRPATSRLPVVVWTSSRESRDLERAYALRANSYLVKPIDSEAFDDAVQMLSNYWLVLNELPG